MSDGALHRRWGKVAGPLFVLRAIGQGAEFLGWVILARRLGASAFGQLAVAFLVCRYAGVIADWGAVVRGVRDVAGHRGSAVVRALIRRRTALTVVLGTAYIVGCLVLGLRTLVPLVAVIAALGLNRDWVSLGRERGARSAVPSLVQGITIALLSSLASPDQPTLAVGAGYAAAAVCSLALNRLPRSTGPKEERVPLDAWMLVAIVTNQIMSSADTVLLAIFVSTADAGIYAAVYRLPNGWLAAVAILGGSLLPLSARLVHDPHEFRRLRRGALRVSVLSAGVLIAAIPVVYLLVPIIFGTEYEAGRLPVVLLLGATALATAAAPLHHLYLAFGDDKTYARFLCVAAFVNVAANLALIPAFSMTGAALATLLANAVLAAELAHAVRRYLQDPASVPRERDRRPA